MRLIRFLRFLKNCALLIVTLVLLFVVTSLAYFIFSTKSDLSFIPQSAKLIFKIKSINRLLKEEPKLRANIFTKNAKPLFTLTKTLRIIKKHRGQLFKRLLQFYNSPTILSLTKRNNALMTIDVGWKALFFSSGLFAIRSIYSTSNSFAIGYSEQHSGGIDFNLYSLTHKETRQKIYFALFSNIILIANSSHAILNTLTQRKKELTLTKSESYEKAEKSTKRLKNGLVVNQQLCLEAIPFLRNYPTRQLFTNKIVAWLSVPLKHSNTKNIFYGVITVKRKTAHESLYLQRFLHSNQYRPQSGAIIPSNASELFIVLFDELKDFQRVTNLFQATVKEKKGSTAASKALYLWSGNELAFFYYKNSPVLAIQSFEAKKTYQTLKKDLSQTKESTHRIGKSTRIKLLHIKNNHPLNRIAKIFLTKNRMGFITYFKNFLLYTNHKKTALQIIKKAIQKKNKKLKQWLKRKSANIIIKWQNKKPHIKLIQKIMHVYRFQNKGSLQLNFSSGQIFFYFSK